MRTWQIIGQSVNCGLAALFWQLGFLPAAGPVQRPDLEPADWQEAARLSRLSRHRLTGSRRTQALALG